MEGDIVALHCVAGKTLKSLQNEQIWFSDPPTVSYVQYGS